MDKAETAGQKTVFTCQWNPETLLVWHLL